MEKPLNSVVKTADWGTGSLTVELIEGTTIPKIGDKITTGDVEAVVTSVNKELNKVSFLLTKTPSLRNEIDLHIESAKVVIETIAQMFYDSDIGTSWAELSESSKEFYRDKAISVLEILEKVDLLRYGSLIISGLEGTEVKE